MALLQKVRRTLRVGKSIRHIIRLTHCAVLASTLACGVFAGSDSAQQQEQCGRAFGDAHTPGVITEPESGEETLADLVAHRGFAGCFPENTLTALDSAFDLGARTVEVDVSFTLDSVPILMHDSTVDRTTNSTGLVRDLTAAEIARLDACSWFGSEWASCAVPTLEQALEAARGRGRLLIDVKGWVSTRQLELILGTVYATGMQAEAEIGAGNPNYLRTVRGMDSEVDLAAFRLDTAALSTLTALGQTTVFFRVDAIAIDSTLIAFSRDQGLEVGAWTISRQQEADLMRRLGIRRILTDYPFPTH